MANSIVGALVALFSRIFPPFGTRRAVAVEPTPQPSRKPEPPCGLLPERMSPYAREMAEIVERPIVDTTDPVRPYVLVPRQSSKSTPEERIKAYRRWELDMAARGRDVGPAMIHGVLVGDGARTLRVAVAV